MPTPLNKGNYSQCNNCFHRQSLNHPFVNKKYPCSYSHNEVRKHATFRENPLTATKKVKYARDFQKCNLERQRYSEEDIIIYKNNLYVVSDKLSIENITISVQEANSIYFEDIDFWYPTIGEQYFFVDINKNICFDTLKSFEEGFTRDFSVETINSITVKNYCPCCYETEPYISINRFEFCFPESLKKFFDSKYI